MDPTLRAILAALFDAHQTVDQLRAQNRELQTAYTDLKAEKEAHDAVVAAVG